MSTYEVIFIISLPIYALAIKILCDIFFGKKIKSKKIEFLLYFLLAAIIVVVFIFVRIPIIFLSANFICFYFISCNYDSNLLKRVTYSLSICLFLFAIEIISASFIGFFELSAYKNSEFTSTIALVLNRVITLILAYTAYKYKKTERNNLSIPAYYYFAHIFILFGTMYLFLASLEHSGISQNKIMVSSIVVLLVNFMIIFLDEKIYELMFINMERNALKLQIEAHENQTDIINSSLLKIKSLKHDMKNHILAIQLIYKNKGVAEFNNYTNDILKEINDFKSVVSSENFIIDSIINFKLQDLAEYEVDIKLNVDIPSELNIPDYDLTVIFGNLLDNAITAIKKNQIDRKLMLSVHYYKGSLIILIDNSYDEKLNVVEGEIITTKIFKSEHSFGLQNIRKIIEKYNGEMQIDYTSNIFSVSILIPCLLTK